MKILYIGSEPGATQVIAAALRNIAPDVAVSYTSAVDQAVTWIDENPDLAALIVEPDLDPAGWPSVLKHARRIASQPPVVVMAPEGTFRSLPDQSVVVDRQRELEAVVDLERAARMALEQKLAQAVEALESAEQTHRSAMAATSEQLANVQTQYEIAVARSAATWDMVDEQLREAAMQVDQSRRQSTSAAAEADRLARRDAELSSLLTEAKAAHASLQ